MRTSAPGLDERQGAANSLTVHEMNGDRRPIPVGHLGHRRTCTNLCWPRRHHRPGCSARRRRLFVAAEATHKAWSCGAWVV